MMQRFKLELVKTSRPLPLFDPDPFLAALGELGLIEATSNCGGGGWQNAAVAAARRHAIKPAADGIVRIRETPLILRRNLVPGIHDNVLHRSFPRVEFQPECLDCLEDRSRGCCIRCGTVVA